MHIRSDVGQYRKWDLKQLSTTNYNGRIEILAVEVSPETLKRFVRNTTSLDFLFSLRYIFQPT